MSKRLTKEEKNKQVIVDIINEMFVISNNTYTYQDIENRTDDWYNLVTMSEKEYFEWLEWGKNHLCKKLRIGKKLAEIEMSMMGLRFGLRIDNKIENRKNKLNEILKDYE